MADELVFYTNPMSRGRMIRWLMEEVGQPYRTEIIDFKAPRPAEFLAISPMGKVPAITHGGTVVTESAAICAYLADAFPDAGLAPPTGSKDRGAYYRWLCFVAGPVEASFTDKALGVTIPEDKKGMVGYRDFAAVLDTIEQAVKDREFVAGDRFSAADLYLAAHLSFQMGFGMMEKRPAFVTYVERHEARPAAVRAREIDDGLIAEQKKQSADA